VCGWEGVGGGGVSCVGDHILQEFNTLFQSLPNCFTNPNKNLGGELGSLRQINTDKHLPQSSFTGQLVQITTFGIAFYLSNLSTVQLLNHIFFPVKLVVDKMAEDIAQDVLFIAKACYRQFTTQSIYSFVRN
jgi:hypothetical protein